MLRTMYRWCVAAFSSGLWNIPTPVDQVLDGHIVQTHVRVEHCRAAVAVRTASREEIREYVVPDVSPWTIGNCMLAVGLRSRVPLARLPFKPRYRQARLFLCRERIGCKVEWRSVVFSIESRFYLYACAGRTRVRRRSGERHLPECIRPRHIGPNSGLMVWGIISYNSRSHLVFLQVK